MLAKIKFRDIDDELSCLDSDYRESLAKSLAAVKLLSNTPLKLKYGTMKQQDELEKFYRKSLTGRQIKAIFNYISNDMKGDYQYGRYSRIASFYNGLADQMIAEKKKNRER